MEASRIPPQLCSPTQGDVSILREMLKDAAAVSYVGTAEYGGDYIDYHIVVLKDRSIHIIGIRRMCPSEKEAAKILEAIGGSGRSEA